MLNIDTKPLKKAFDRKGEEMKRKPTAIAVLAGVNPDTADRILTGEPGVSLRKITQFAESFGFDVQVKFVPQS